jgi:Rps23 Pro-64 3,4-dihydroxylase Tpa1-like proline 4-hydroxylase
MANGARISAIELARHHDAGAYARVFKLHGRLHIPDLLTPASAEALHTALAKDVPYDSIFNKGDKVYFLTEQQLASLKPEQRSRVGALASENAAHDFQYFYETRRLSDAGEPYDKPGPLRRLTEFLNGPQFLNFAKTVTGDSQIAFADAQATRYRKGHFLTRHNDDVQGTNRRAAYVLGFTRGWRADWGGVLVFLDKDGHVSEGYTPAFNVLNIFRVPQEHLVTQVASYAAGDRLSVTGWLRARPNNNPVTPT